MNEWRNSDASDQSGDNGYDPDRNGYKVKLDYAYDHSSDTHTFTHTSTQFMVNRKNVRTTYSAIVKVTLTPFVNAKGELVFKQNISETISSRKEIVDARCTTMDCEMRIWMPYGRPETNLSGGDGTREIAKLSDLGYSGFLSELKGSVWAIRNYVGKHGLESSPYDRAASTAGLNEANTWMGIAGGVAGEVIPENIRRMAPLRFLGRVSLGVSIGVELNKVIFKSFQSTIKYKGRTW